MAGIPIEDRVLAEVRRGGLLGAGPVVVLVSGGRDSTCLLDVAVRLLGPGPVLALHLDYGLRPGAAEDEAACARLCAALGVPLEVRRPRRPERGNLHAWARAERYAAAGALAEPRGARVAAGHTASDQVETVLYRLAASPGRRALLGMPGREGALVRPLLAFSRADTADYCRARGLTWREDPSNSAPEFARARVRHGLLPALEAVHPAAAANVARTAALLRDEAEVLDGLVRAALWPAEEISAARLRDLPPALGRLVLQALADAAAGGTGPAVGARLPEVLALAEGGGTRRLDLGGGLRACSEYGVVRVERAEAGEEAAPAAPVKLPVPGRVAFGAGEIECEVAEGIPPGPGVLAREAVGAALEVRRWRPGDRMSPLGLGGTRSLQDLFCDRKVPRARRGRLPVVLARGEVAWVPGVATSERFRARGGASERRVRLRWRETGGTPA